MVSFLEVDMFDWDWSDVLPLHLNHPSSILRKTVWQAWSSSLVWIIKLFCCNSTNTVFVCVHACVCVCFSTYYYQNSHSTRKMRTLDNWGQLDRLGLSKPLLQWKSSQRWKCEDVHVRVCARVRLKRVFQRALGSMKCRSVITVCSVEHYC